MESSKEPSGFTTADMRGVKLGASGSNSRAMQPARKSPASTMVSVWSPFVTTSASPIVRTGW